MILYLMETKKSGLVVSKVNATQVVKEARTLKYNCKHFTTVTDDS